MTHEKRVRLIDRILSWTAVVGCVVAFGAIFRDYQTRQLVDGPARTYASRLCDTENHRWSAYFTKATAIANKRRPGETVEAWDARKKATLSIVDSIRKVTAVDCQQALDFDTTAAGLPRALAIGLAASSRRSSVPSEP